MSRSHLCTLLALAGSLVPAVALAQPASTNLGTVTLGTPINVNVPTITAGNVAWYTFTLAAPISYQDLRFLSINNTNGVGVGGSDNVEIGLYNATGARIGADDDDGLGTTSLLTFGTGTGVLPVGTTPTVNNGRDGDLAAGVYYLGVAYNGVSFGTTNWSTTFGTTLDLYAHTMTILADNTTTSAPGAFTNLGTLPRTGVINQSDTLAAGQVRWYKVVLPDAVSVNLTYVDMDSETSSLSPANATRISMYGPNGAIQSNATVSVLTDTSDGSGSLSQLTFGQATPTRPAVGDGSVYNGRDGTLRPGTYYIAVCSTPTPTPSQSSAVASNFNVTSTSTNTGTVSLNLASDATQTSPTGTAIVNPVFAGLGSPVTFSVTVTPGANPASTGILVTVDGSLLNAGTISLLNNGVAPDVSALDNIYTATAVIGPAATSGINSLPFSITDAQSRSANGNINFTVVGNVPACPAGNESFSFTALNSDGALNGAANTTTTFDAVGAYEVGSVRISGRFVCNNAFGANARVRVTSPTGANFDLIPFTVSGPSGVPVDVATVEASLPCGNLTAAGQWTVRIYESVDDAGVDGTWSNLCVSLVSGAGPTDVWSTDACGTDAPNLPATAQVPTGSGALNRINGIVENTTDVDMYRIGICDVANFTATTLGFTTADTQLWLFNLDGTGVMHNDDTAPGGLGLQSTLNNTGGQITVAGDYLLALSPYNCDAFDVGNALLFANTPFGEIHSADGPGALNPVDHWTGVATSTTPFAYGIVMTGVCIPGGGGGGGCNIADITQVGGTVEVPGTPDNELTVDDVIVFVNAFGDGVGCPGTPGTSCNIADITEVGGTVEAPGVPDGELTVDDLIVFFNAFGNGCV